MQHYFLTELTQLYGKIIPNLYCRHLLAVWSRVTSRHQTGSAGRSYIFCTRSTSNFRLTIIFCPLFIILLVLYRCCRCRCTLSIISTVRFCSIAWILMSIIRIASLIPRVRLTIIVIRTWITTGGCLIITRIVISG
ncbi:hypothetical protein HanIR_Chr15g0785491 [Helianthus annuus]|nr:hypothetical protein HanIR_Chr15g0785491 [Helianthus annuus]